MKRDVALIVALILAAAKPLQAQGCERTPEYADEARELLAPLFFESDSSDVAQRGSEIQQLSPGDSTYVVRDDSVCARIVPLAVSYLRQTNTVWAAGQEGRYSASVYRFGPYYAVSLGVERSPAMYSNGTVSGILTGPSPVIVYRAADMVPVKVLY
jgi:hypothetical protein